MNAQGFWDNQEKAQEIVAEFKDVNSTLEMFDSVFDDISEHLELIEMMEADGESGEQIVSEIESGIRELEASYRDFRLKATLSGEYDSLNAFFSIHSGAGGTESCDWTGILLRMYTRWFESRGWSYSLIDENPEVEAGFKSVMLHVKGSYVYGYLQSEVGVHRLVRISPFDAKSRRHTSFSAVDVIPEYKDQGDIVIDENDLRIDTYRSSGAGGQHVNTTDSAVRITHIPSGIVVACQQERSQHKNKAMALKVLQVKLDHLEKMKKDQKLKELYGDKGEIAWGNQIRSYVFTPYTMVRDHRTDVKVSDYQRVLDGDLDEFVSAFLEMKAEM